MGLVAGWPSITDTVVHPYHVLPSRVVPRTKHCPLDGDSSVFVTVARLHAVPAVQRVKFNELSNVAHWQAPERTEFPFPIHTLSRRRQSLCTHAGVYY